MGQPPATDMWVAVEDLRSKLIPKTAKVTREPIDKVLLQYGAA